MKNRGLLRPLVEVQSRRVNVINVVGSASCFSICMSALTPDKIMTFYTECLMKSCDSSVGIALGYGLDDRGSRVRFLAGAGNFSHHHVQSPPSLLSN
jgi:hypothetical protein